MKLIIEKNKSSLIELVRKIKSYCKNLSKGQVEVLLAKECNFSSYAEMADAHRADNRSFLLHKDRHAFNLEYKNDNSGFVARFVTKHGDVISQIIIESIARDKPISIIELFAEFKHPLDISELESDKVLSYILNEFVYIPFDSLPKLKVSGERYLRGGIEESIKTSIITSEITNENFELFVYTAREILNRDYHIDKRVHARLISVVKSLDVSAIKDIIKNSSLNSMIADIAIIIEAKSHRGAYFTSDYTTIYDEENAQATTRQFIANIHPVFSSNNREDVISAIKAGLQERSPDVERITNDLLRLGDEIRSENTTTEDVEEVYKIAFDIGKAIGFKHLLDFHQKYKNYNNFPLQPPYQNRVHELISLEVLGNTIYQGADKFLHEHFFHNTNIYKNSISIPLLQLKSTAKQGLWDTYFKLMSTFNISPVDFYYSPQKEREITTNNITKVIENISGETSQSAINNLVLVLASYNNQVSLKSLVEKKYINYYPSNLSYNKERLAPKALMDKYDYLNEITMPTLYFHNYSPALNNSLDNCAMLEIGVITHDIKKIDKSKLVEDCGSSIHPPEHLNNHVKYLLGAPGQDSNFNRIEVFLALHEDSRFNDAVPGCDGNYFYLYSAKNETIFVTTHTSIERMFSIAKSHECKSVTFITESDDEKWTLCSVAREKEYNYFKRQHQFEY
jgi:hypothetical protein